MTKQELFKQVYEEILDYVDEELVIRCANWGYGVSQTLLNNDRYLAQSGAEQNSPFMYAVTTAVMISEFAERAFNDHFDKEVTIDLDLLGIDFEEIRGFTDKDIELERLELLKDTGSVGLQDIWIAIGEWKLDIHKALVEIYNKQGDKDPAQHIFNSLLGLYKETDEGGYFYRHMTDTQQLEAYSFISNGFNC